MEVRDERKAGVLRGRAYDEMKLQPEPVKEDYELLLEALERFFGNVETDQQITRRLMNRTQKKRESVSDYSHELTKIGRKLKKSNDKLLRENFVEGLKDANLRWDISKLIESKTNTTFLEAREIGRRWEHEVNNCREKVEITVHKGNISKTIIHEENIYEQIDHEESIYEPIVHVVIIPIITKRIAIKIQQTKTRIICKKMITQQEIEYSFQIMNTDASSVAIPDIFNAIAIGTI